MSAELDQVSSMASSMTAISMNAGVNDDDFEKFMKKEVFPTINLATRLFEIRRHVLLKSDQKVHGKSLYLWTIYATTTNPTQGQNHFVDLLLDSDERARLTEQLKHFGAFVGFELRTSGE
jgi:hypothetical protein